MDPIRLSSNSQPCMDSRCSREGHKTAKLNQVFRCRASYSRMCCKTRRRLIPERFKSEVIYHLETKPPRWPPSLALPGSLWRARGRRSNSSRPRTQAWISSAPGIPLGFIACTQRSSSPFRAVPVAVPQALSVSPFSLRVALLCDRTPRAIPCRRERQADQEALKD